MELRAGLLSSGTMSETTRTWTEQNPFLGDLTCKEWAAFVYVHSRDHADQIEKVKANPDCPR